MSDSVPLNVQNSYPEQQQQSPGYDAPMDSGEEMSDHPQQSHNGGFQNPQSDNQTETTRPSEIHQQLNDLSEQQVNHEELPREALTAEGPGNKSIYIGNVDYDTTEQELQELFSVSGAIERVNIMKNKATGAPKGFAYLEFVSPESAQSAIANLDGTLLRDRELKVSLKRTNVPGMSMTERGSLRGRGRGRVLRGMMRGRGRGLFRGPMRGRGGMRGTPNRFAPY